MTAKKEPGTLPDPIEVEPITRPFDVTITPPGSKSLTCRAYILAALADGESRITRPLRADDTDNLLGALGTLGADSRWADGDVLIRGVAGRFPRGGEVNLGDGGAPSRFMIAAACLAAKPVTVDGSARMRQRPVGEGVEFLRRLGATIDYLDAEGRLPVRVTPSTELRGGDITIGATASSQSISALLLVGGFLPDGLRITSQSALTSGGYVLLTQALLQRCAGPGADGRPVVEWRVLEAGGGVEHVVHPARVQAFDYEVEPDMSSALYWLCAAATHPESSVVIPGVHGAYPQPDAQSINVLERAGAILERSDPTAVVVRGTTTWRGFWVDARQMPDAAVALGAAAALADGPSTLTGLHTLRYKESDRIAALAAELAKFGCRVSTDDESITVEPRSRHNEPVVIETYNDHRMAMAFAILGLARAGVSIRNPACVSKSYPAFWSDLARLYD